MVVNILLDGKERQHMPRKYSADFEADTDLPKDQDYNRGMMKATA